MLTIFSCPKPFRGHINIIQRNAIKSWTLLEPRPEIILIGDEEGTAEICKEFGLRHIPKVDRNEFGTPLVSSIFEIGQNEATNPLVCYVNADIILMSDFIQAVKQINKEICQKPFLAIGRRWDLTVDTLDFENPDWELRLRDSIKASGKLDLPSGIDYFLFPVGLWKNMPPLILGRCYWDNWLIYDVHSRGILVIDLTPSTTVVHQTHDYSHIPGGADRIIKAPEMRRNWKLQGQYYSRIFNTWDATHYFSDGLKRTGILRRMGANWIRLRYFLIILLVETLYPYSLPLNIFLKSIRGCVRFIQRNIKLVNRSCR